MDGASDIYVILSKPLVLDAGAQEQEVEPEDTDSLVVQVALIVLGSRVLQLVLICPKFTRDKSW